MPICAQTPMLAKVKFGHTVVFTISDEDNARSPIFLPRHRTCDPPSPILKRMRKGEDTGYSRFHAYPRPRANIYNLKPWSETHHRRGSDADSKPPKRRSENQGTPVVQVVGAEQKSPRTPSLQVETGCSVDVDVDILVIPPSPMTIDPPTRTSSPPPQSARRRKRDSLDVLQPLPETVTRAPIARPPKHRRTKSRHHRDSFDLQSLATALPPSPDYRLHLDLSTTRPLFWCLFDVPSTRSVEPNTQLDLTACPGAASLTVHTHPFFPPVTVPGTATIQDVLYAIYVSLHEDLGEVSEKEAALGMRDRDYVVAAKLKRHQLRGCVEEDEIRLDLMDGFVMFQGLEVIKCEGGGANIECQLHLKRERSWEQWP
ncbi:hypothetical protein BDZ89DRAFT_1134924 [Hymenopellis radicata]|nr:hypothetical protein BDZ89DRAFT_1134924 [Hymenopellis radicata]